MGPLDLLQEGDDSTVEANRRASERRVVVAEDHAESRDWLVHALRKLRPSWHVCATASNPQELVDAIEEHVPELLILDVHLTGGSTSIEVLGKLPYPIPIVFTSGDPSFAIEAFEHAAVDYVLKPVRFARLERALKRVDAMASDHRESAQRPDHEKWIIAHKTDGMLIIRLSEIVFLQARGKFTLAVTTTGEAFVKRGIGQVERLLDPTRFVRIHRGTIINFDYAGVVNRDDIGRMRIQMRNRTEWLDISQTFEQEFKNHMAIGSPE